jgi:hypothetical protein
MMKVFAATRGGSWTLAIASRQLSATANRLPDVCAVVVGLHFRARVVSSSSRPKDTHVAQLLTRAERHRSPPLGAGPGRLGTCARRLR